MTTETLATSLFARLTEGSTTWQDFDGIASYGVSDTAMRAAGCDIGSECRAAGVPYILVYETIQRMAREKRDEIIAALPTI